MINTTERVKPSRDMGSVEGVCGAVFLDGGHPVRLSEESET